MSFQWNEIKKMLTNVCQLLFVNRMFSNRKNAYLFIQTFACIVRACARLWLFSTRPQCLHTSHKIFDWTIFFYLWLEVKTKVCVWYIAQRMRCQIQKSLLAQRIIKINIWWFPLYDLRLFLFLFWFGSWFSVCGTRLRVCEQRIMSTYKWQKSSKKHLLYAPKKDE